MKLMVGKVYDLFEKYTLRFCKEKYPELSEMQVARKVMLMIVEYSYTFEGDYGETFHCALGNCNVTQQDIAIILLGLDEQEIRVNGKIKDKTIKDVVTAKLEQVNGHIKYAQKK